jgi:hypothetical protein
MTYDTKLIAGQAEVLMFVDRKQAVASPSAKMGRGYYPTKDKPHLCAIDSARHIVKNRKKKHGGL